MPYKKYSKRLIANEIRREINVYVGSMVETDKHYDLVLCSAFKNSYEPIGRSFIESLYRVGVSVEELSKAPAKNGKDFGFWISKKVNSSFFDRLCCFEFLPAEYYAERAGFREVFDYFITFLTYDTQYCFKSIATPLLGTKNVGLSKKQIVPIILQTALRCFVISNHLREFSIYVLDEDDAKMFNDCLITLLKKPYDIFISYPHSRTDEMLNISSTMEKHNIVTWTDKKRLKGGDDFDDVIANAIDRSKIFLFLWSKETEESIYCGKELEYALDLNKRIIPYRFSKSLDGNTPLGKRIGGRNWLDVDEYDYEELARNIELILHDIKERNRVGISEE